MFSTINKQHLNIVDKSHGSILNGNYQLIQDSTPENLNYYTKPVPVPFQSPNTDFGDLNFGTNFYRLWMESTLPSAGAYFLPQNHFYNYDCNIRFDPVDNFDYNKNYKFYQDNQNTNNVYNFIPSVEHSNEMRETQLMNQTSNMYASELFTTARYPTADIEESLKTTMPRPTRIPYSSFEYNEESTESETDFEDIERMKNPTDINFLTLSDKSWCKMKSKGMFRLGNKGRAKLKSEISRHIKKNPHLRKQVNTISGVRRATTRQLFQLAQICGITYHLKKHDM